MCGFGGRSSDKRQISDSNSAIEILDKRYALGGINREEYEENMIQFGALPVNNKDNK